MTSAYFNPPTRVAAALLLATACTIACGSSSQTSPPGGGGSGGSGACSATGETGCEACVGDNCCSQALACTGDCESLAQCIDACSSGGVGCIDSCMSAHPAGATAFQDLLSCTETSCKSACIGGTDAGSPNPGTSITVVGDSTNGIPESTVTSVTCNPGVNVVFAFPSFGQYAGLTTYIVPGDAENNPRVVVEASGGLLYWGTNPGMSYPTSGSATLSPVTLTSLNSFAPGTVTISGSYSCD